MDVKSIAPDLKKLGSNLDKLEATLQPLIDNLGDMSSELPLLDKAKLMALTAYSIESLLFCMFRPLTSDTYSNKHQLLSGSRASMPPTTRS
jgi:exosome complex protein LRP1